MRRPGHQGASVKMARLMPMTTSMATITPMSASPATNPAVNSSPVRMACSLGFTPVCFMASSQSLISSSSAVPNFCCSRRSVRYRMVPPAKMGMERVNGR